MCSIPKLREPNRVEFFQKRIQHSKFESADKKRRKKWLRDLRQLEVLLSVHPSESYRRLEEIVSDRALLEALCRVLRIKPPQPEVGIERTYSFQGRPDDVLEVRVEGEEEKADSKRSGEGSEASVSGTEGLEAEIIKVSTGSILKKDCSLKRPTSPYKIELSASSQEEEEDRTSEEEYTPRKRNNLLKERDPEGEELEPAASGPDLDWDLQVHPPSSLSPLTPKDILIDTRSPWQKFFLKEENEIRSNWRPELKLDRTKTAVELQSEEMTEKIAHEFIEWTKEAGISNMRIDEGWLKELFEVGSENPATRAITVDVKELPFVPSEICDMFAEPHASERAALHRQILWDMLYERGKEKKVAFGSRLDSPRFSWHKDTESKWFSTDQISPLLISGASLWGELLYTEILDYYCMWLERNKDKYKKPDYLEAIGYFEYVKKLTDATVGEGEQKFWQMSPKEREFLLFNPQAFQRREESFKESLPRYQELLDHLTQHSLVQDYFPELSKKKEPQP